MHANMKYSRMHRSYLQGQKMCFLLTTKYAKLRKKYWIKKRSKQNNIICALPFDFVIVIQKISFINIMCLQLLR